MAGQNQSSGGIAERYATAIFELADETGQLDAVETDLIAMAQMIDGSDELAGFIASPLYSRDEHKRALAAVMQKAGTSALTQQFVGTVAQQRRLFALPGMITSFRKMLADKRGEVAASVESAHPLTEQQLQQISSTLAKQLGREVTLEASVDESLLGGLVVRVGSRMIDSSLRTKLNRLQLNLKEAS